MSLVVVGCFGLLPFPQFLGEVLFVFLFFGPRALVFFGCVALPFGNKYLLNSSKKINKYLLIQKKKTWLC